MSQVSFTNDQMNGILAWMEDNNASAEEGAVYFLTNNKDLWAGWLDDAAERTLAAVLQVTATSPCLGADRHGKGHFRLAATTGAFNGRL